MHVHTMQFSLLACVGVAQVLVLNWQTVQAIINDRMPEFKQEWLSSLLTKLIVHDTCMCGFHAMGHLDSHSNSSTSDCSCDLLGTKPHFVMESQSVQSVVP